MSVSSKIPLSIVDLNADCLLQIFSYLQLPDLLNFRFQCSTFNDVVCKYLPHLTTLSVVYSDYLTGSTLSSRKDWYFGSLDRSQKRKPIKVRLDDTHNELPPGLFGLEDSIIIFGRQKYENFLEFIKKYDIRSIKKLAMIIDADWEPWRKADDFSAISVASELLNFFPKVKSLLLDRTHRYQERSWNNSPIFKVKDLKHLFGVIIKLSSLTELYFFSRRESNIAFDRFDNRKSYDDRPEGIAAQTMVGNFLSTMLQKLRIFSMNHADVHFPSTFQGVRHPVYMTPILGHNFENLQELGLQNQNFYWLINSGTMLKNLHTLTIFGLGSDVGFQESNVENALPKLKTLNFSHGFSINKAVLLSLNSLPNLENLSALSIDPWCFNFCEKIEDQFVNNSIKHIRVKNGEVRISDMILSTGKKTVFAYTKLFQRLLTVTVLQPEVVVYEGDSLNDMRITDPRDFHSVFKTSKSSSS